MDFARRAYNHSFRFDPIIRSLLDTDFYKLLMGQMIWKRHMGVDVTFALTNRTKKVRISDIVDINDLRDQLDHVKSLRFEQNELIWLRGQTFYGVEGLFCPEYIEFLRDLRLPDYTLTETADGQFDLLFTGEWAKVTFWEIYAMAIVNELRYRALMAPMPQSTLDLMYARAKVKLYDKLERLAGCYELNLTDFGTRRRHSFLWQEFAVQAAREVLGPDRFTGTSNAYLAMKHGLEAKGTNAHELPMVYAAMANSDDDLRDSQYKVLRDWEKDYHGNLLMFLPDTFGTTQFLEGAPVDLRGWTGARPDSKNAIEGGEELIDWWSSMGVDPRNKLILFSDGLDVALNGKAKGEDIIAIADYFRDRVRVGFGWGTNLTNDFNDTITGAPNLMAPISLVCKVKSANGRAAVKLSDNYEKATGPQDQIDRYRRVFGTAGVKGAPVTV